MQKLEKNQHSDQQLAKKSLHRDQQQLPKIVMNFTLGKVLSISSTKFQHKNIYNLTWISPKGKTQHQGDHILMDKRHGSDILKMFQRKRC